MKAAKHKKASFTAVSSGVASANPTQLLVQKKAGANPLQLLKGHQGETFNPLQLLADKSGGGSHVVQRAIVEKTLPADEARLAWLGHKRPTFSITGKYQADHVLDVVSKSTALAASKTRFVNDGKPALPPAGNWNAMTWTECTDQKMKDKANSAANDTKMANIHIGKQQLSTPLKKIKKRTVRPSKLTYAEKQQMPPGSYETYEDGQGNPIWVHFSCGEEVKDDTNGVGKWVPEAGTAEIHHYGNMPAVDAMQPKYLKWNVDDVTQLPDSPKIG